MKLVPKLTRMFILGTSAVRRSARRDDFSGRKSAICRSACNRSSYVLLLVAVLLVSGPPIAFFLVGRTAGDKSRMGMAGVAAELMGIVVSGVVVNILKQARAQRGSRLPTLTLRSALVVARVAFWGSILLAAALSCAALFFFAMSFGLSG